MECALGIHGMLTTPKFIWLAAFALQGRGFTEATFMRVMF